MAACCGCSGECYAMQFRAVVVWSIGILPLLPLTLASSEISIECGVFIVLLCKMNIKTTFFQQTVLSVVSNWYCPLQFLKRGSSLVQNPALGYWAIKSCSKSSFCVECKLKLHLGLGGGLFFRMGVCH